MPEHVNFSIDGEWLTCEYDEGTGVSGAFMIRIENIACVETETSLHGLDRVRIHLRGEIETKEYLCPSGTNFDELKALIQKGREKSHKEQELERTLKMSEEFEFLFYDQSRVWRDKAFKLSDEVKALKAQIRELQGDKGDTDDDE